MIFLVCVLREMQLTVKRNIAVNKQLCDIELIILRINNVMDAGPLEKCLEENNITVLQFFSPGEGK